MPSVLHQQSLSIEGHALRVFISPALPEERQRSLYVAYQEEIDALCDELRLILIQECAAGNWIAEIWRGWPQRDSLYIMLGSEFRRTHGPLPATLRFISVDDPHYWKAEILSEKTRHVIACRFGNQYTISAKGFGH